MAKNEKGLIDLWFPNDYYDILDYTNVDYKSVYSHENQYVHNMKSQNQNYRSQVHVSSKGKSLMVEKKQPISRETFEVVIIKSISVETDKQSLSLSKQTYLILPPTHRHDD